MGWRNRDFYLGHHAGQIFDRNGNAGPTAWWNGRIIGGWTQDEHGTVIVVPARPIPRQARVALAQQAKQLTTWLDRDIIRTAYQSPLVRG